MAIRAKTKSKAKAKTATRPYEAATYLRDERDMAAYLEAALESASETGDVRLVAVALGEIARARGMSQLARDTGLNRESLYSALSSDGNPEFGTVMKVLKSLNIRLHASVM